MADPIKFIFPIQCTTEVVDVVAYLPFDGAEFCVHRHLNDIELWNVTHTRTGLKLPIDASGSQADALDLASRLSAGCPSATSIVWDGASDDGKHGKAAGPIKQLAAEVRAVLAA